MPMRTFAVPSLLLSRTHYPTFRVADHYPSSGLLLTLAVILISVFMPHTSTDPYFKLNQIKFINAKGPVGH